VTWQPEGNFYDKYHSRNPLARRMMAGFLQAFDSLSAAAGARTAYEVGCGEGHLSFRMARRGMTVRASDISERLVKEANRQATAKELAAWFEHASIYDLNSRSAGGELVVCCEVLEHLDDPAAALDVLSGLARPYLLASVPREPLWRVLNMVRGSYWRQAGNTPGHVNHWSTSEFLRFLRTRFEVVAVRTPVPWTMALCRVATAASELPFSRIAAD
jgi:2-polyprenyl-3-methyl-5-hydroxy-6-metoxy-1,4-benzoquinol methylase